MTRSFDELADRLDAEPDLHIRVERMDGSIIEGRVVDIAKADLLLLDAAGNQIPVSAPELRTVDAFRTRRVREWTVALGAIPAVAGLLVVFVQLPWVQPLRDDIATLVGFGLVYAMASGLMAIARVGNLMQSWFTQWQRLYSSTQGNQSP